MPVLISSSGSPPTGDGSDHQIIRPTPRRATELVIGSSSNDQIHKIVQGGHQEVESVNPNKLGLPALPTNPPPISSVSLITTNSFSYPISAVTVQSFDSQKRDPSKVNSIGENGLPDMDISTRRISRNNSQQYFDDKRNIFSGVKLEDRSQSHTPTKMATGPDLTNGSVDKAAITRKASFTSSISNNKKLMGIGSNPQINGLPLSDMVKGVQEKIEEGSSNIPKDNEQIPVRDTGSINTPDKLLYNVSSLTKMKSNRHEVPSSEGGLVTNVVVDGSSVPDSNSSSVAAESSNKLSSVMYVESTATKFNQLGLYDEKEAINNSAAANDDSGYQILSSRDEEAERDLQKNNIVSPSTNAASKGKKETSKQGRSSLIKYKAYQGRSKPKRKPQGGVNRSRNGNVKNPSAHFHSNDTNADEKLTKSLENANRLLDVKNAIEQLKIRSSHHPSNYTNPGYSSNDNDNTSTSSYSSASDDSSDNISNTTKVSNLATPISSSSSYPVTLGAPPSLHAVSPLLSASEIQKIQKGSQADSYLTSMVPNGEDSNLNADHFPPKVDPHHLRNVSSKKGTCNNNNVPDETHNTTVTSADEFVWIDSYNRLVELQKFPWNHTDLCTVMSSAQSGRDMSVQPLASSPGGGIGGIDQQDQQRNLFQSADILPRLSYYLQRALVRIAREAQRLSKVNIIKTSI